MKHFTYILLSFNFIVFSQETKLINIENLDYKIIKLSESEIQLDSLFNAIYQEEIKDINEPEYLKAKEFLYREYKLNMGRDFLKKYVNNSLIENKKNNLEWKSVNCECNLIDKYTIEIKIGFDFMCFYECDGHIINIKNGSFNSNYTEYRNDQDIYKESINDKLYKTSVKVNNQFSKLTLNKKLKFEHNEPIEGNLEYETLPFFRKNGFKSSDDTLFVKGTIHFKCILKDENELKL